MKNEMLADVLIARLNVLIEDQRVRLMLGEFCEYLRLKVDTQLIEHPTIQISSEGSVGFLGLLNGIVGVIEDGPRSGWGHIARVLDDSGNLVRFERVRQ